VDPKAIKIADIQALRGVAILFVLIYHFSLLSTLYNMLSVNITSSFHIGVELFFVISGYVVMLSLIRSNFNILKFAIQRIYRLYPAIIGFLIFSACTNLVLHRALHNPESMKLFMLDWYSFFKYAFAILTGTLNFVSGYKGYSNGAMWSLSVEMQFYFFLGLVCVVSARISRLNSKNILRFLGFSFCLLYFVILYYRLSVYLPALNISPTPPLINFLIAWRFDFLVSGVLLAISNHFIDFRLNLSPKLTGILFYVCLFTPIIICTFCESPLSGETTILTAFGYPITNLFYIIVVALAIQNAGFSGLSTRSYHFLMAVGERSYTIYLLHFPLFLAGWALLAKVIPGYAFHSAISYGIWQIIAFVLIGLPVIEWAYRYIEIPWIKRGKLVVENKQQNRDAHCQLAMEKH
jgi:peptidoglycan/LPS O-acetylase OafA/YrhL